MIQINQYESLGKGNYGWLNTSYHFSFANYYNPHKTNTGTLRVLNDDYIKGYSGFDSHPHNDMEIITYVVEGKLTHQDSMGNKKSLGRHGVQYMSAGTGVVHSESNDHKETLHLYQLWIYPDKKGHTPNYGDYDFSNHLVDNQFTTIVGSYESDAPIKIHQDAKIQVGLFKAGETINIQHDPFKYSYLVLIDGQANLKDEVVNKQDAIESTEDYTLHATKDAHILWIQVQELVR